MSEPPYLLLLRHGKAAQGGAEADHERPLTTRGREQSAAVGRWLAENGPPDAVWCSSAVRARETWEHVAAQVPAAPEASYLREWYDADADDGLELLHSAPASAQRLLVVGHNPTIEELAGLLTHEPTEFRTGTLGVLRCDQPWPELATATLDPLIDPRDL